MSTAISSGVTSVTGSVTSTAAKYDVKFAENHIKAGTVTLGTVGANKKWTITGITLNSNVTNGNENDTADVLIDGVIALRLENGCGAAAATQCSNSVAINMQYSNGIPLATTKAVTLTAVGNNNTASASIFYVEEAV